MLEMKKIGQRNNRVMIVDDHRFVVQEAFRKILELDLNSEPKLKGLQFLSLNP